MKSTKLSESSENYLIAFFEILIGFERAVQNRKYTSSIAFDFANDILLTKDTMAKTSRIFLCHSSYIPLQKIANELIENSQDFEKICKEIKNNANPNSEGASYLFQNREDRLFEKTFMKAERMREYNNTDRNFIKQILLLSMLEIGICKNLLRFETDELTDKTANDILSEGAQRLTKLRYLLNCV